MIVLFPCLEVIKLELILRLKINRSDWLFADTCPHAANRCTLSLRLYSSFITSKAGYTYLYINQSRTIYIPGRVAPSVTCLAADACLTADAGVASSIPAWSYTFLEIDHEIISTVILLPSTMHSRRGVVSYKRKYVHELLVICLFKLAKEKVWLGKLIVPP